ncbi:MAG: UvrD-helicase domain-containing protein [Chloroflexi bacterium]|nr:UvrD-helicase domain-containing protein [Chloroflexota bacterium]
MSFENLNEQQLAAVTAPPGAVMVVAGPGSGKTRVLTQRIAFLLQEQNVAPWRIMAVTFTNKAAREMRERLQHELGEDLRGLSVGTFHATCARLLRREGDALAPQYTRDFVIFDTDDQKSAVKQALEDLNLDPKKFTEGRMSAGISAAKNVLITPADYQATDHVGEVIKRVYARYQEILQANNAMDFDDLLLNTVLLLQRNPLIAEKYRQQYQHVLIDEFQDTNLTQYNLIRRLVGEGGNLFIVGDTDQSIYKWRGADIRNLQRFQQDYPEATTVLLEENYRSTQTILDAATAVIRRNRNRVDKSLRAMRGHGELLKMEEAYNEGDEAYRVLNELRSLMVNGYNAGDVAIMYRTNAQSRALEEAFIRAQMPYKLVGGLRFYSRKEVKDVLAYLRVIQNPADEFSLYRIINVPKRGIGAKTWEGLRAWAQAQGWQPTQGLLQMAEQPGMAVPFSGRALAQLMQFAHQLRHWFALSQRTSTTVADLLDTILKNIDYKNYLGEDTDEGAERWENVMEFRNVAAVADDMPLSDFLEEVALVADVDSLEEGSSAVTMLTLHASKGLEFPVVFLVGLEEGILPHSRSLQSDDPEDLAEERRLFYVGLTRAKDRLFLYHSFQRTNWGQTNATTPSRFLADIPAEMVGGLAQAGQRRQATKQSMSSWSSGWNSGSGGSGGGSRSSSRPSSPKPKWQQEEEKPRNAPQTRRTQTSIPSVEAAVTNRLPQPNSTAEPPRPAVRPSEPQFRTGQKVRHAKFGDGVVIESKLTGADEEVAVAFADYGIKKLAASMAKLEVLS